ncbi:MAG: tetratricopeptide repeat protein, partial [Gammaproteobacteria bacterium]|nr:tetratricopeptide repeat protein [Gammaproteobacteria bacterium]
EKVENSPVKNAESLIIEAQKNNQSAATEQDKVSVSRPVVTSSVSTSVPTSTPPVLSSRDRQAVAIQATPPAAKPARVASVMPRTTKSNSEAEKSIVEEKQQQQKIKPVAIKKTIVEQPTATQKPVLAKAEGSDETDNTSEIVRVVSKKQREYTSQEKSQHAYAAALSLYNKGSKQQAKASLKEALSYSTTIRDAYNLLAVIYIEDGRIDLASEILESGLSKHINDQALLRLYLQSLVQEARYKEAITVMEKRLRLTSPEDLGYLAGLYQKQNNHFNAVKFYSRALQLKPSTSLWWMGQGISLEVLEQHEEALQSYQQSISTGQLTDKLAFYVMSRIKSIKQLHADSVP